MPTLLADLTRVLPSHRLTVAVLAIGLLSGGVSLAQESGERESAKIEPYTGPPIFLPKVTPPPPPVEVEAKVLKHKFPDSETIRFERRLVRYSDESLVADGIHKEYFSNGQLYVEGNYKKGKATGEWTYHHANGTVAKKVTYQNGKPNGEISIYNPEGKLVAKREYLDGRRTGTWETYSPDGEQQLRLETYVDGKANGQFKVWFSNGQLRQEMQFKDGKRDGVAKEWTRVGDPRAEVTFRDGKKEGKSVVWGRDGKKIEQQYKDGVLVSSKT